MVLKVMSKKELVAFASWLLEQIDKVPEEKRTRLEAECVHRLNDEEADS